MSPMCNGNVATPPPDALYEAQPQMAFHLRTETVCTPRASRLRTKDANVLHAHVMSAHLGATPREVYSSLLFRLSFCLLTCAQGGRAVCVVVCAGKLETHTYSALRSDTQTRCSRPPAHTRSLSPTSNTQHVSASQLRNAHTNNAAAQEWN
jgi:hypothetical protein